MIFSTKLLVATLGVSHFSGVAGSKQEREELRRNLRQGERRTQFMFTATDDQISYDDYFAPGPEEIGQVADLKQVDDFFKDSETGTVFDWDAAGVTEEDGRVYESSSGDYTGKASKIGKMLWDETPVTSKQAKGSKTMKGSKGGLFTKASSSSEPATKAGKSGSTGRVNSAPSSDYESHSGGYVVEEASGDGWLAAFSSGETMGYSDLFGTSEEMQQRSGSSGHVTSNQFKANGGSNLMTGRMEGQEAPTGRMFDDDYFNEEERLVFLPRPTVTVGGSLFSVNPQTIVPPVVPDGSGNTLTLGTEYLFNEIMSDAQNIGSQLVPVDVDNEQVLFSVALDGTCDRIGPADQNSVQGYCFFTYTFIDPATQLTGGSFTAQGIIVNSQVPGQLTVTGGTGILTGASGLVEILPADVDQNVNPPELVQPAAGIDPFNEVAGWAHFFEFDVDVLFFLPELYER